MSQKGGNCSLSPIHERLNGGRTAVAGGQAMLCAIDAYDNKWSRRLGRGPLAAGNGRAK